MIALEELGENAIKAKYELNNLTTNQKNEVLQMVAAQLLQDCPLILAANQKDMEQATQKGMNSGLIDRLLLTKERIKGIAESLLEVSALQDPVGEVLEQISRPNGLTIEKRRVPIGVIGIIYESRPNVTADAFSLCFKTGNAVILKGGSDAILSNIAITESIRTALEKSKMVTPNAIQLITATDRETTKEFMKMKQYIDVLIPRGGAGLIQTVVENSSIPVIETGTGNCHIYVDESANLADAVKILFNAKTQRIGVCNSCESLVVHENIVDQFLPLAEKALQEKNVEMRGDQKACDCLEECIPATNEDYGTEYLDYILSIKTVSSLEEAITHINQYSTKHSDAIITSNKERAEIFLHKIDSACVYVNASTRFTDGFEFGFGAEIGISTQKLHARGPMGLKELTTYKYTITGNGQIRE